jgi:glutathione synthase
MMAIAARVASALSVATAIRVPSALGACAARAGTWSPRMLAIASGTSGATLRRALIEEGRMRFVYVMDPMDRVLPDKDTTFALQRAAQRRGHVALHCLQRDLFVRDGELFAKVRDLKVSDTAPFFTHGPATEVRVADADGVLIRKDPPFDPHYLYTTLLLERVRGRTILVNDPRGLRDANEKLYALHFARHMPRSLVSCDSAKIFDFVRELGGKAVIKPLFGAGGQGVMLLDEADKNKKAIVEMHTAEGTHQVMIQQYLPAVTKGDKRVLLLDGQILGAINRVPKDDDLRSNIHVGGRVEPSDVTPEERAVIADMAGRLKADGLAFVGLDFIGDKLTEVNVTSPTGIQELSQHLGRDVAEDVIKWLEARTADLRPNVAASQAPGPPTRRA